LSELELEVKAFFSALQEFLHRNWNQLPIVGNESKALVLSYTL